MKTVNQARDEFLANIVAQLSTDVRFPAAWLTGSLARDQQDAFSDIDLTLVVSDEHTEELCARPWEVSAQTTPQRYVLFSSFGKPGILHENNHNAPEDGTFTFVAYAESTVMVDWVLRPLHSAQRPANSTILWEHAGIPLQPPAGRDELEKRAAESSEIIAFFWMMAAVTVKYIYRGDDMFVNIWLEELAKLIYEVERRVKGQVWEYRGGSFRKLAVTVDKQLHALRQLCERVENLMPLVQAMGGHVMERPMEVVEALIVKALNLDQEL